ncbi:DUF503 domain-containing protein [Thermobrachium celere]|uniref:YlxP-like protein n=1 Tax=Thermobrachium celere DSM 8682 TaxID=941824 RepID=R7RNI3_9CLOT|nr:DUF503 domain-containing protein [Thermobrachium celere]GFR35484.1 hypothetical protein TCEA9_12960 [Thermobrachium celere]CDF57584.1 YlxP-like protein [Thermobrachium celere DSM 8682]
MIIGYATITLMLYSPSSLKEKRQIIKSILSKIRTNLNVSCAEVGLNDKWQLAQIGVATISNDKKIVDTQINSVINIIERDGRAEIVDIFVNTI